MSFKIIFTYIFFQYCIVCAIDAKTIGIFTYNVYGAKPWDADSIHEGIPGSEEAVIYISQKLADQGHEVIIFGNPPKNSRFSEIDQNPQYLPNSSDDKRMLDIAIAWRQPTLAKELRKRSCKVFLWPHDTCHDQSLTDEQVNGFDDVLWLSEWQREQWTTIHADFSKYSNIYGNGINPENFCALKKKNNPYSCIYGSNYARGLEILLDIWPTIKILFPRATLDIYYGWQHWGLLSQEKEEKMRAQIASLVTLGVCDHGLVSHKELNNAYEKASLWTYPCIGWEVFCISALKAQYAGAIPVIIDGTGLKETVRFGYRCTNPQDFLGTLIQAMLDVEKIELNERERMREFIQNEYTWERIAQKWLDAFY